LTARALSERRLKSSTLGIEEGKADILGLYIITKLYESGDLTTGELMGQLCYFSRGHFPFKQVWAQQAHTAKQT
jgi:hypothetical protein